MDKLKTAWDWFRSQDIATQSMLGLSCSIMALVVVVMLE